MADTTTITHEQDVEKFFKGRFFFWIFPTFPGVKRVRQASTTMQWAVAVGPLGTGRLSIKYLIPSDTNKSETLSLFPSFLLRSNSSQNSQENSKMVGDILLQVGLMLVMVYLFLAMHGIPNKLLSKLRNRNRADVQAKRHFVIGAQLLARARGSKTRSTAISLAKEAEAEADKAIAFDPKDAAAHILKSLALDLQGFKTSALDSLDVALSPLCAKSLSDLERGDSLFKRAELKVAMARGGKVDSAVADLTEALTLSPENANAFRLLGECYETKKMGEEAKKAYEDALRVDPKLTVAREALDRLGS